MTGMNMYVTILISLLVISAKEVAEITAKEIAESKARESTAEEVMKRMDEIKNIAYEAAVDQMKKARGKGKQTSHNRKQLEEFEKRLEQTPVTIDQELRSIRMHIEKSVIKNLEGCNRDLKDFRGRSGKCFGNYFDFFWKLFDLFLGPLGGPWAPQGPKNGPRDPGDRFKIQKKKSEKFGPEV